MPHNPLYEMPEPVVRAHTPNRYGPARYGPPRYEPVAFDERPGTKRK